MADSEQERRQKAVANGGAPQRRRSPWPRGLRAHPKNDPLAELPGSHPATQAVIAQMECRRDCVGREIEWLGREAEAFDQQWHSTLLGREFSFSSFAYCFISYTLILDGWLSPPPFVTDFEQRELTGIPLQNKLLDECEEAARTQGNSRVLDCIAQVRRLNQLLLAAIHIRLSTDGLPLPSPVTEADAFKQLGLTWQRR